MFVKWRMTANPFTIGPGATVPEAIELMTTHKIRKLPVLDGDVIVGIVTQSDIDRASPSRATSFSAGEVAYIFGKLKIHKVMTKNPLTVSSDALLEEAAILMRDNRIEILPVVEDGKLVGVITESDLLDALIELNGARNQGTRLAVEADDKPGVISRLTAIVGANDTNINHVLVYRGNLERSLVLLGLNTFNTDGIERELVEAGFTIRHRSQNQTRPNGSDSPM